MKIKIHKLAIAVLSLSALGYTNANAAQIDYSLSVNTDDNVAEIGAPYDINVQLDEQRHNLIVGQSEEAQPNATNITFNFADQRNRQYFNVNSTCNGITPGNSCKISITPKDKAEEIASKEINYTVRTTVNGQVLTSGSSFEVPISAGTIAAVIQKIQSSSTISSSSYHDDVSVSPVIIAQAIQNTWANMTPVEKVKLVCYNIDTTWQLYNELPPAKRKQVRERIKEKYGRELQWLNSMPSNVNAMISYCEHMSHAH
ncbi:hypothetical protein L3V79_00310 [Thiotrichales bacterium 19S9-12]|nr:hypothetical protein [Thiotrichales bacterium 19S9-11]MCF6810809.1 hypothetical protein [Thiotrichales bacterium 19S9-12]